MILKGDNIQLIVTPSIENGEERLHIKLDGELDGQTCQLSASVSQEVAFSLYCEIGSWLKCNGWSETTEGKNEE